MGLNYDQFDKPTYALGNRLLRAVWQVVYVILYRTSPKPLVSWRAILLRMFGARLGASCHFHRKAIIWAPWNLECEDYVTIADGVNIYNTTPFFFGSHAIVSQDAFLCGATHDYNDITFRTISKPIKLGAFSWIAAKASVMPGVTVGAGAVLALGGVASRDLEPWSINAGVPARKIGERNRSELPKKEIKT